MRPAGVQVAGRAPGERSFLKWAGGKTRYAGTLVALAPEFSGTYREPFLGSGAVFFELRPARAVLSDANGELVVCFQQVLQQPRELMALLDTMPNTAEYFERTRRRDPAELSELERAARVIYLNKTSFRGLWRVNRKGEFNTPYGAYDRPYYNRETLSRAAEALSGAAVAETDFETAVDAAEAGDWVFLDPPYVPLGGWADFKRYTAGQFGAQDHVRLCAAMRRADRRGVHLMLTNSDTDFVRELFGPHFHELRLPTRRDINLVGRNRGSWDLVFTNYEPAAAAPRPPDPRPGSGMARIGP
ncbi:Dam family site-specific DNA-(adenine-N6)-methyltransferase [Frankia sp. AgB1.9]|uniref:DNA adenine methylase n=1 Tax=unclassified Frankia TaxID=2632575 RepID=UPI001933C775|nr:MULTISPECIES: Dam family site-specific DNA-(adenine-N6)-methyltransferase [unclassified Frankia]MBL7487814.1 Dam family site-specific DNA-(adenine-N6)-methyltransferase [Frankia sp. AgW1.1]MBL7547353.1 Dam family site-specific DNA-(adenine-N6)-methyltransferase [Frankia sp. AgB1.9]MBL7624554.1 Dam family site-specific DNA-(adenine-N6)-methyltransferase [Frankia sp. AgB1.8]